MAVAVEEERPNIKFLVVEEYTNTETISLKNLEERIGNNSLLMQFFSEKTYVWKMIIQILKALRFLNNQGQQHGDINPNNILIMFNDPETSSENDLFRVKVLDFLKIKELGEIAMAKVKFIFYNIVCIERHISR